MGTGEYGRMADNDSGGVGCGLITVFVLIFGPATGIGMWWRIEKQGQELNSAILASLFWSVPITLGVFIAVLILFFVSSRK